MFVNMCKQIYKNKGEMNEGMEGVGGKGGGEGGGVMVLT